MFKKAISLIHSKRGQAVVEYAIILALISVVCITITASLGRETGTIFGSVNASMGSEDEAEDAGYFEYTLTGENAGGKTINSEDLLASSTTTYSGGIAYTGFCSQTACANWDDAQAFVAGLNASKVDGKTTWRLLSSEADARALNDAYFGSGNDGTIGGLYSLWSSASSGSNGYLWGCFFGFWFNFSESHSNSVVGFVVVCGS